MSTKHSTSPFTFLEEDVKIVEEKQLIVYNDDYHTFDFVIEALVKICSHEQVQAEQCTLIIHFKGKCSVKTGDFYILRPMFDALCDKGLTASIE